MKEEDTKGDLLSAVGSSGSISGSGSVEGCDSQVPSDCQVPQEHSESHKFLPEGTIKGSNGGSKKTISRNQRYKNSNSKIKTDKNSTATKINDSKIVILASNITSLSFEAKNTLFQESWTNKYSAFCLTEIHKGEKEVKKCIFQT